MAIEIISNHNSVMGRNSSEGGDVRIAIYKATRHGTHMSRVAILFWNDAEKKVSTTRYISIGMDYDLGRMYFINTDRSDGYKLSGYGNGNAKRISFSVRYAKYTLEQWTDKCGEYNLLYDRTVKLYYVDFSRVMR